MAAVVPAEDDFNNADCIEPLAHTHYGWCKEHGGVSHSGPVGGEVSNECYSGGKASTITTGDTFIHLPHYLSIHLSISSSIHRSVHLPPHCHAEREGRAHTFICAGGGKDSVDNQSAARKRKKERSQK